MAACKFTDALTIKQSNLPVTCKLQNPPGGVTIAMAVFRDSTGSATSLTISGGGLCFPIPKTVAAGNWDLEVRVKGGTDPISPVDLVEDCDAGQLILTITDPRSKAAHAAVVVQL